MRILYDGDFEKWRGMIKDTPYDLKTFPIKDKDYKSFIFYKKDESDDVYCDPKIGWSFKYMVIGNKLKEFYNVFFNLLKKNIINPIAINGENVYENINFNNLILDTDIKEVTVKNVQYAQIQYLLFSKLSAILGFITVIEDAFLFFNKIWDVEQDTGEIKYLLQYAIGDVVNVIGEEDKNEYVVTDYDCIIENNNYCIKYIISKVEKGNYSNITPIVKFVDDKDIKLSKNNKSVNE